MGPAAHASHPDRWAAELVVDAHAELAECPLWDEESERLFWVDIMAGAIHTLEPSTGTRSSLGVGQPIGAIGLRRSGGLVLALQEGFGLLDPSSTAVRLIVPVDREDERIRMNDGACDSQGRFWAGTTSAAVAPGGATLYRLDPDGKVMPVVRGVTISNGIGWSPDDGTLYYVDTPTGWIDAFAFDTAPGTISHRRHLVRIESANGAPDGLAVDETGAIWVALWEGSCVRRYSPQGELVGVVDLPVSRVTSCCFGGPNLDELYITTARPDATEPPQPGAGGLFLARPGVTGLRSHRFGG